ncbi:MAG: hypothetical protein IT378_15415 [Sandaracinaceae bacterium]|nr:hypothetical protein [Sandaracinaceae bacterium]
MDAACMGSGDCCDGLACQGGVCRRSGDVTGPDGCGTAGNVCCDGFTCRTAGLSCVNGSCVVCGADGQACCNGASACQGSLSCLLMEATPGGEPETRCINPSDPMYSCGAIDQPCCAVGTGESACEGELRCVTSGGGSTCLNPEDEGGMGQPCGPRGGCDPGLICNRTTNPSGVCEMTPGDCGRDGQGCCMLGGSENTCEGQLNCQFNECSTCRGPSLTCLLGGLLPGQECCSGSVCRPAPLIPRCCMGEGGTCESGLDCCGLMRCNGGTCSCSNENSFCLDSSECCEGLTCQTFLCRPSTMTMCKESGETCVGSNECCDGLSCGEFLQMAGAAPTTQCCAGGETSCETREDCCGEMLCVQGECECRQEGASCFRDNECCDGRSCIAGECTTTTGCGTPGQPCAGSGDCCGEQQACARPEVDGSLQCCTPAGRRCNRDEDCCGLMTCSAAAGETLKRCQCLSMPGAMCANSGDCCGAMFCPAATDQCE